MFPAPPSAIPAPRLPSCGTVHPITVDGESFSLRVWGDVATASTAPIAFMVHGAGMSAMSWDPCCNVIAQRSESGIVCCALDLRGHGSTAADAADMSRERLVHDVVAAIDAAFEQVLCVDAATAVYLIGHSLGGALVANVAHDTRLQATVAALLLVDIVEDTAVHFVKFMPDFLARRPLAFGSVASAVQWHTTDGGIRNVANAQLVVPSLVVVEDAEVEGMPSVAKWRTDLPATAPFWEGWFADMDRLFLDAPCPKLLLLANTDRLDKALTVAQMQGRFQLEVLRDVGHHVMVDDPEGASVKIVKFVKRVESLTGQLQRRAAR
jgi:protein phosphatase methylesterase 1